MPKKSIPIVSGGSNTPTCYQGQKIQNLGAAVNVNVLPPIQAALASNTLSDNTKKLLATVDDELMCWICAGLRDFFNVAEVFNTIIQIAQEGDSGALGRIKRLAELARYVAEDTGNSMDCARERFEEFVREMELDEVFAGVQA